MSDTKTLLLELHCEEIPARFLSLLLNDFSHKIEDELESWFHTGDSANYGVRIGGFYSPRKLAWRIPDIPIIQTDQTETQPGPLQRLCVDEAGQATLQGQKFAEKWGVPFSEVRFETVAGKKEPCAVVTLTRQGRPTVELLAEALPRLIAGLHVPKAMRWGHSEFEFVRPIRNVLCLFGSDVVPFDVDGVKASHTTWGHRLYHLDHPAPIAVTAPEAYESALKAAGVVASFHERRADMEAQLHDLAKAVKGRVVADDELLSVLAEIVECPKVLRGEFPLSFLDLPKEVLVTSLKEHQKSFCVESEKGELLPFFLTAANRADDPKGFVQGGNEWVLKARLYDARFFFAEDQRHPLAERLESLKALTFQRELGSYFEKTERVEKLMAALAPELKLDAKEATEAARLAKADLRTLMVGEFPELQGVMGGEYLRREGAPEGVWKAVKEQYRPVGAEDDLPATALGCLLSMADKLDTVVGCFAVGLIPSGSKDPLALRRAGQGIVRILWERGWGVSPENLMILALGVVGGKATQPAPAILDALKGFFRDRVAYQLERAGYAPAVRRSALAAGWENLTDLKARCEALSAFAEDPRFGSLAQSAKRIGNILKDESPAAAFDEAVLAQPEEQALAAHLNTLECAADHASRLAALANVALPLEAFFNAVMVKCEDATLRAARLSLLHRLQKAFLRMADFSQWQ
ncbi:MAG: glycine--tRNA ligase subunit beta [Firmicutes bacterium]|nr:glycine--tRNA ligase subunit beta [Bacillota bacterium]